MSSRKEEKERLRQQRLAAEKAASSADRKRLIAGYVIAGILVAAVAVGVVLAVSGGGDDGSGDRSASGPNVNTSFGGVLPDDVDVDEREGTPPPPVETGELVAAADAAGCKLQQDLPDEGATHLNPRKDELPDYKTNPPTSGDHYPIPLADGAFLDLPDPGNFVHNLEHGRIQIQYKPDLPEADQLVLKGVFDENRPGMVMFPNPDLDTNVAVVAWNQLMSCKAVSDDGTTADAIRAFRNTYLGRGPEAIPY